MPELQIKSNCFKSRSFKVIQQLRDVKDFCDVTFSVGLGGHLPAHRLILSACSPVLRALLSETSSIPHTIILLHGVNIQELEAILDFCYTGEARVAQERLTAFLAMAEQLQVDGLVEARYPEDITSQTNTQVLPITTLLQPPPALEARPRLRMSSPFYPHLPTDIKLEVEELVAVDTPNILFPPPSAKTSKTAPPARPHSRSSSEARPSTTDLTKRSSYRQYQAIQHLNNYEDKVSDLNIAFDENSNTSTETELTKTEEEEVEKMGEVLLRLINLPKTASRRSKRLISTPSESLKNISKSTKKTTAIIGRCNHSHAGLKRLACRKCPDCRKEDCRNCKFCEDKVKYGGPGKLRQSCAAKDKCGHPLVLCPGCSRQVPLS